jgi:EAL domain-containing protein (putative c-di-GMP-specific phosphodiesterase class I)/GGDEF domain-containing protein/CBS domain-containing protein
MDDLVRDILRHRRLQSLFQPILDLDSGHIHGYEGLIRGPSDSMLHSPLALLKAADQAGLRAEIEILCVEVIIGDYARLKLDANLFINLSPRFLNCATATLERLLHILKTNQMAPERIVIELTEDSSPDQMGDLGDCLDRYRELGLRFALDDLGEGYSSLRRWSEHRPHYVKIDKHFTSGINQDPVKLQFVRSLQQIAVNSGAKLIAEGIETRAEFAIMREIGISLGQGYFIARPNNTAPGISIEAMDAAKSPAAGRGHSASSFLIRTNKLLIDAPYLQPGDSNEIALDTFNSHPHLHALAVVESGRPIGLINRYTLVDHFSRVYVRELHGRRTCTQFMDTSPLVVDKATPVEELSKLVIHKGKATFTDGFIITDNGQYLGLGSGYDLMEVIMQLQIAAARYSNPLTQLPGNVPINNHIQQLLDDGSRFWAAYCDLDNFKPFNDIYGYDRGDEIILLLSGILKDEVDTSRDFLGHIGGDDFFILFRSEDWEERCQSILSQFAFRCHGLFQDRHLADGGYYSEDRCGRTVFHPLPSLSIGIVTVDSDTYQSHHEVAGAATVAKKQAKKTSGNSLFVERRQEQQVELDLQAEAA